MKSTTEDKIKIKDGFIHYPLRAKNYRDIIESWQFEAPTPLYLILFVLPENYKEWVHLDDRQLITKRCAYWYKPQEELVLQESEQALLKIKSSKTIYIDTNNLITLDTINELFNLFYNEY